METSTTLTSAYKHQKTLSMSDNLRDSYSTSYKSESITNEKLRLSFENQHIQSQIVKLNNRISKILANERKTANQKMNNVKVTEESQQKKERNRKKYKEMSEISCKRNGFEECRI
jgi:hypothetical protein